MKVLCCGDRNWQYKELIYQCISTLKTHYKDDLVIIHGAASGADTMAGEVAIRLQLVTIAVPAKWDTYGNSAGPIRNEYMLRQLKPHLVVAFHKDIESSKGTKHMVRIANEANVPVILVRNKEDLYQFHASELFQKLG